MGVHNGTTKLQQYTQDLWSDYTNDEDIVIRKSGNNMNVKSKKTKKMSLPPTPKKKVQQPAQPESDSKELKEIKDFLEDNMAVGFGNLVPSTNKKRVRNRKPKAKKQTGQPINLQDELNKYNDGWETMLYKKNKRELNQMKREIEKEEKIQKAQMMNKGFVRHNRTASATTETEVKSPVKVKKPNSRETKMIKKQLDQQIELQKQKQQKKNEMEKWNQKLQNEKKKQSQPLKGTRGKESKFNSIIQEHQQIKEQIKSENAKPKSNKAKQPQEDDVQKIIQKQVQQEKQQKQQDLIKAQKEKKQQKLIKQQKHAQMTQRANNSKAKK